MAGEDVRAPVGSRTGLTSKSLSVVMSVLMTLTLTQCVIAEDDYSLDVDIDQTKVSIVSGNLTAAITFDWPRVIFHHTVDPFSPTFDVGFPRLYLFNDSDGDGRFCRSEATAVGFLDSNHVEWNISLVEQGYSTELGEYARLSMSCNVSAYTPDDNETLLLPDFAEAVFSFSISELSTRLANSEGAYTVMGRNEICCGIQLSVLQPLNATGVVVDQSLQGGGTTSMFLIKEWDGNDEVAYTELSGRVDETELGDDFTHVLQDVPGPRQEIAFSKEDGTIQAACFVSSVASLGDGTEVMPGSSYYTTGSGLVFDTVLPSLNESSSPLCMNVSVLLDEAGFVGGVRDWVEQYLPYFVLSVAAAASMLLVMWHLRMRRKRVESEKKVDREEDGD